MINIITGDTTTEYRYSYEEISTVHRFWSWLIQAPIKAPLLALSFVGYIALVKAVAGAAHVPIIGWEVVVAVAVALVWVPALFLAGAVATKAARRVLPRLWSGYGTTYGDLTVTLTVNGDADSEVSQKERDAAMDVVADLVDKKATPAVLLSLAVASFVTYIAAAAAYTTLFSAVVAASLSPAVTTAALIAATLVFHWAHSTAVQCFGTSIMHMFRSKFVSVYDMSYNQAHHIIKLGYLVYKSSDVTYDIVREQHDQ